MKVKLFHGSNHGMLENAINSWLESNPGVKVISLTQSESGLDSGSWSLSLTLFYEVV